MDFKKLLKRPARLQVDPGSADSNTSAPQGTIYNIWYQRWSGGDSSNKGRPTTNSPYRVNILKDTGYTRAQGSLNICIYFARGCCDRGSTCQYWHRLPTGEDFKIPTMDCFGRDKTSTYQEDMGGVGLFKRYNPTLFVAGLSGLKDLESHLSKVFGEFGPIEKVRVLHGKGCAFIRYRWEVLAQFAKEAMQAQSLGGGEILQIKWAHEDPSAEARKEEQNRVNNEAIELVKGLLKQQVNDETEQSNDETEQDKDETGHGDDDNYEENDSKRPLSDDETALVIKKKRTSTFFNPETLNKLRSSNIKISPDLQSRINRILQS